MTDGPSYVSEAPSMTAERALAAASPDALITRLRAAEEALRAAEARTAWQPIETAPPGEWVLVYGLAAHTTLTHHVARGDRWGWGDRAGMGVTATHWQPLPAAPEVDNG